MSQAIHPQDTSRSRLTPRGRVQWAYRRTASLLILLAFAFSVQATVDPFYENLLRNGNLAASRGDHQRAAEFLRLACFGLLETPDELGPCLTRLALSQGALEDSAAFSATFDRLLEVEDRFQSYSKAELTAEERQQLNTFIAKWVPYETLKTLPVFREAAGRQILEQIAAMPPRERRAELAERLQNEPGSRELRTLAAELEYESGRDEETLGHLQVLLQLPPVTLRIQCLQAWTLTRLERCSEAVSALDTCSEPWPQTSIAEKAISCLLEQRGPGAALETVESLPPDLKRRQAIRRLNRRATAQLEAEQAAALKAAQESEALAATQGDDTGSQGLEQQGLEQQSLEPQISVSQGTGTPSSEILESEILGSEQKAPSPPPTTVENPQPSSENLASIPSSETEVSSAADSGSGPEEKPFPTADRRWLAIVQQMLEASSAQQVREGYEQVRLIAADYPMDSEAQHLAAEFAIRLRLWQEAVDFFEKGGEIADSFSQRQFYYAIALYEIGQQEKAAAALQNCKDRLKKTPFVLSYIDKILGNSAS